jgi:hypothetical protein
VKTIIVGIIAVVLLFGSVALALDDHAQRQRADYEQANLAQSIAVEVPADAWQFDGRYERRTLNLRELPTLLKYAHGTRFVLADSSPVSTLGHADSATIYKSEIAVTQGDESAIQGPALVSVPPGDAVLSAVVVRDEPPAAMVREACAAISSPLASAWLPLGKQVGYCFVMPAGAVLLHGGRRQ